MFIFFGGKKGSITATTMAYILPSICLIMIMYRSRESGEKAKLKNYLAPTLVALIGVFFVISGVMSAIRKIVKSYDCSLSAEPSFCQDVYSSSSGRRSFSANVTFFRQPVNFFFFFLFSKLNSDIF